MTKFPLIADECIVWRTKKSGENWGIERSVGYPSIRHEYHPMADMVQICFRQQTVITRMNRKYINRLEK